MADPDESLAALHESWREGTAGRRELFRALADTMRRGARRGLSITIMRRPNEDDVHEAMSTAFNELLRNGSDAPTHSLRGCAYSIAYRRGQDQGRKLNRERKRIRPLSWRDEVTMPAAADEKESERRERLFDHLDDCKRTLTDAQRDVIESVVQGQVSLSDWSAQRNISYEAGRRTRVRALKRLKECLGAQLDDQ